RPRACPPAACEGLRILAVALLEPAEVALDPRALRLDLGVDFAEALHVPGDNAGVQVRLHAAAGLARPPRERLAEAGGVFEALLDPPLDCRARILPSGLRSHGHVQLRVRPWPICLTRC